MLFNSWAFAAFFPVVLAAYWLLARRLPLQNLLLLAASYYFYGCWDVRFLFLAIFSSILDYYCALMIDDGRVRASSRLSGTVLLLLSAFFLVTVQWHAVALGPSWSPAVERSRLLGDRIGWNVFYGTLAALAVANAAYPLFTRLEESARRKAFIGLSVVGQLAILGFFKYFNFFASSFRGLAQSTFGVTPGDVTLDVVLPVGISFYTFQTMSYTIDVYRRRMPACRSLLDFSAFVSFFPQLVAGPIERAHHMLPQFQRTRRPPDRAEIGEGAWLIAWGLYKKMVVADNMATLVNTTFAPYDRLTSAAVVPHDGLRLLLAVYAFAIQIYCDFSGYSDIARGTARLLGFDIMVNFNLPYFARSPSDFWRRWHISLSSWLRDYLYISLGGNRAGVAAMYRNLMLTMLLGGLWHGASWTFVLWGAYHGALLVIYRVIGGRFGDRELPGWVAVLQGLLMFHLTCLGWLLFRAKNLATIRAFLASIFLHPHGSPAAAADFETILYFGWFIALFEVAQWLSGTLHPMARWPWWVRLNVWMMVLLALLTLTPATPSTFIYFAF